MIATFEIAPLKNMKNMKEFIKKQKEEINYVAIKVGENHALVQQFILDGYVDCHHLSLN